MTFKVDSAELKLPQEGGNNPGVVIFKLKFKEDKQKVISAKNKLKNHKQYPNVYINHDQSRSDRLLADSFRAILSAVKMGDMSLTLRGSRLVHMGPASDRETQDTRESPPSPRPRDSGGNRRPSDRKARSRSPSRAGENAPVMAGH